MGTLQLKSGESKALPWTINLELETGRVAAGTDKDVVAVMDFISSEGLMSRVAHRVVELDEVLADPSRAVGMHPRTFTIGGGDPSPYLAPVGSATINRLFSEYLASIEPVRTIEVDGDTCDVYDVDVDEWCAWIDPAGQVDVFDDYLTLTDYVPSLDLWYVTPEGETVRWGSGESEEEAAYDMRASRQ